jgi:hypothetical protein
MRARGALELAILNHAWARIYKKEGKMKEAEEFANDAVMYYCEANMRAPAVMAINEILGAEAAKKYKKQLRTEEYRLAVEMSKE